jgi:hypothetical protein
MPVIPDEYKTIQVKTIKAGTGNTQASAGLKGEP